MADEYKINVKDVDDTSSPPAGAYYIPTDDLGSGGGGSSELPAVTSDDNGDVLTVVSGAWAKADPPSSLPAVTVSDNGDVLTVVEGAWAKAAPAGAGGFFLVTITWDDVNPTCDKTYAEITAAFEANMMIVLHYGQAIMPANIEYFEEDNVVYIATMASVEPDSGVYQTLFTITSDGIIGVELKYPSGN